MDVRIGLVDGRQHVDVGGGGRFGQQYAAVSVPTVRRVDVPDVGGGGRVVAGGGDRAESAALGRPHRPRRRPATC